MRKIDPLVGVFPQDSFSIVSLYCAKENILKITFFYDFDMALLWFCYGLDMVDFMDFLCVSKSDMFLICFFFNGFGGLVFWIF